MERRKMIKGLAAALSGLAAIPGCIEETEETEEPEEIITGAMCYVVGFPVLADYVCPYCGNTIKEKYNKWMIDSIKQIDEIFKNIKGLGYDVVLDKTEFCPKCSKTEIQNPVLIFKIRFSEEDEYHIARSNIVNEYQCLYEYLSDPDKFTGDIAIIQKMTGLRRFKIENQ